MSIDGLDARLTVLGEQIGEAQRVLGDALDLLDRAAPMVVAAIEGTSAVEALNALASLQNLSDTVATQLTQLASIARMIEEYRASITAADSARMPRPGAATAPAPAEALYVSPQRIEELRRQLPPRVISRTGQKTHGRWIDPAGNVRAIISGRDEAYTAAVQLIHHEFKTVRMPSIVVDTEFKLAAHMRRHGIRSTTLVVNHTPCGGPMGCDALIPVMLPAGSTMTVYGPDGFRREYKGGATSRWFP